MYISILTKNVVQIVGVLLLVVTGVPISGPFFYTEIGSTGELHHEVAEDGSHKKLQEEMYTSEKEHPKATEFEAKKEHHDSHSHEHPDHTEEEGEVLPETGREQKKQHMGVAQMFITFQKNCFKKDQISRG